MSQVQKSQRCYKDTSNERRDGTEDASRLSRRKARRKSLLGGRALAWVIRRPRLEPGNGTKLGEDGLAEDRVARIELEWRGFKTAANMTQMEKRLDEGMCDGRARDRP